MSSTHYCVPWKIGLWFDSAFCACGDVADMVFSSDLWPHDQAVLRLAKLSLLSHLNCPGELRGGGFGRRTGHLALPP